MKLSFNALIAVALFTGLVTSAHAQSTGSSTTVGANATVVPGLQVRQIAGSDGLLDFGSFAAGPGGGTVTARGDSTTPSGDVTEVVDGHSAIFEVTGIENASYRIDVDPRATLTRNGGGASMVADLFVEDGTTQIINNVGNDQFRVGGVLQVGGAQPVGRYSGTFNVSVNYI